MIPNQRKKLENLPPVKPGPTGIDYFDPVQHDKKAIETATDRTRGFPGAQVARTDEFADYQDDAVVSREIVRKPTGNVTFFAFDEGQGLSEHTAPFDALVQVVEGEVEITISGKFHRLQGGEMILMPAGQPHALRALKRFKMILAMILSEPNPNPNLKNKIV